MRRRCPRPHQSIHFASKGAREKRRIVIMAESADRLLADGPGRVNAAHHPAIQVFRRWMSDIAHGNAGMTVFSEAPKAPTECLVDYACG